MTSDTPPLIERFVVMGIDTIKDSYSLNNAMAGQIVPTFIDIFPFDQQTTPTYLDNFKLWCFPDGFTIYDEHLRPLGQNNHLDSQFNKQYGEQQNIMSKNSLHHFVLTNSDSDQKFCTALLFHKQLLSFLYKFTISSKLTKYPAHIKVFEDLMKNFSTMCLTLGSFSQAEKAWDEGEYQECLKWIISKQKNQYLFQQNNQILSNKEEKKYFKIKEEQLVHFLLSMAFRAHSLLTPQFFSQNTEVIFELANEEVCRLSPTRQQTGQFFTINNFSFRTLFEKISIQNILALVSAIILERQIIIISSNPNDIIAICESLLSLIYPLKWVCIYIPLLPPSLVDMLSALMPYIVGMSKPSFQEIQHKVDMRDKLILDLDTEILSKTWTSTIELPQHLSSYLSTKLKGLCNSFHQKKDEGKKKEIWWLEVVFQLKRVFLNFMTCLINNFTPYLLYSSRLDRNNVAAGEIFSNKEYLEIFFQSEKSFMIEFSQNTMVKLLYLKKILISFYYFDQMFSKFLEESYRVLHVIEFQQKELINRSEEDKEGIIFFLKNNKKIQKSLPKHSSENRFDIIQNPMAFTALDLELGSQMEQAIVSYNQPKVIDLTGELIKYLKYLESIPSKTENNNQSNNNTIVTILSQGKLFEPINKQWLLPHQSNILLFQNYNKNYNSQQSQKLDSCNNTFFFQAQQSNTLSTASSFCSDPFSISEHCQEPCINKNPVMFFRNMYLEYDSWERRVLPYEEKDANLKYPCLEFKNYSSSNIPQPKKALKKGDPVILMIKQEQLCRMIQQIPKKSHKENIFCTPKLLNQSSSHTDLYNRVNVVPNQSPVVITPFVSNQSQLFQSKAIPYTKAIRSSSLNENFSSNNSGNKKQENQIFFQSQVNRERSDSKREGSDGKREDSISSQFNSFVNKGINNCAGIKTNVPIFGQKNKILLNQMKEQGRFKEISTTYQPEKLSTQIMKQKLFSETNNYIKPSFLKEFDQHQLPQEFKNQTCLSSRKAEKGTNQQNYLQIASSNQENFSKEVLQRGFAQTSQAFYNPSIKLKQQTPIHTIANFSKNGYPKQKTSIFT